MVEHAAVNRGVVGSSPTRGVWENPQTSMFAGFGHIGDGGEEIWKGNVLLIEKDNPQWLNEIVTLIEEFYQTLENMILC